MIIPVSFFLKMTVCHSFEGEGLPNDLCGCHCQSQSGLCIVKNPEDGDFHTSGDSTAEFSSIYYCLKKRCPKVTLRGWNVIYVL